VIPHIHDGNAGRLEVEQEVSSVVNAPVGDSAFSDIVTNKRTIQTVILADDAQTIVLGGLIQDDVQETVRRVPFLSAIPLAGKLFQSNSQERVKRNLLVFLRPTILRSGEEVADVTDRKYRGVWTVQGALRGEDRQEEDSPPAIDRLYEGRDPARQP
jgi:general secretion pathway protein D